MINDEMIDDGTIDELNRVVIEAQNAGVSPQEVLDQDEFVMWQSSQPANDADDISHYDNLVDKIDDGELNRLAMDIINWTQYDERSRDGWSKREKRGIQALGVSDSEAVIGADFEGASRVVHPLLAEAVVQFHSRALPEIGRAHV